MVCPESANFFYGEYGEYGVSRESMSNPGKPGFSFCFSIQVPLQSYASSVFSVFSVFSVSVRGTPVPIPPIPLTAYIFFLKKSRPGSIPDLNCGIAVLKYWNRNIRKINS